MLLNSAYDRKCSINHVENPVTKLYQLQTLSGIEQDIRTNESHKLRCTVFVLVNGHLTLKKLYMQQRNNNVIAMIFEE